ncbi:hypothetical protein GPJ56_002147 [Histomonas meleagridis]|uniref:uncharacterized protein n=1 Tax=Histomonas meleagridis TaxID=135588 RepID=UPI00355A2EDB|nr:hypothetical protein GPJ56_002147 [Histomonas meleagridis]KAH0806674.1 hypothetical protein GO595_000525 [Histomonas meleagridis]
MSNKRQELCQQILKLRQKQEGLKKSITDLGTRKKKLISSYNLLNSVIDAKVSYHILNKLKNTQIDTCTKSYKEEKELQSSLRENLFDLSKKRVSTEKKINAEFKARSASIEHLEEVCLREFQTRTSYHQLIHELSKELQKVAKNPELYVKIEECCSKCSDFSLNILKIQRELDGLKTRSKKLHNALKCKDNAKVVSLPKRKISPIIQTSKLVQNEEKISVLA